MTTAKLDVFDSHFHIIDHRFPLISNQGYIPDLYTVADYRSRMSNYKMVGGAVVTASFQGIDQSYLFHALKTLGPRFVGVTQLPTSASDAEIINLDSMGVRAIRFNLLRDSHHRARDIIEFAHRVYDLVSWHSEFYLDDIQLHDHGQLLAQLPSVCIDHLGLRKAGFKLLLSLVEKGLYVKASGCGRVDFDVKAALREIYRCNEAALLFGTDLPSTRALRPYNDDDYHLVIDALGTAGAKKVLSENAKSLYKVR